MTVVRNKGMACLHERTFVLTSPGTECRICDRHATNLPHMYIKQYPIRLSMSSEETQS